MTRRVLLVGCGPLGRMIAADLHARGLGQVVAAADPAPGLAGTDLAVLLPGALPGARVAATLEECLPTARADVAIVATSSDLRACAETFRALLQEGLPVVSTCEELLFPWLRHEGLARELDALARSRGGRITAAGVNPGFLMDALPVFATAPCRDVRSLTARRIQDAAPRRIPFQRKIGATLTVEEFHAKVAEGSLRHVGLLESLHFVARGLDMALDSWNETLEPVMATRHLECALGPIPVGRCAGVRQVAHGVAGGRTVLELEFQAAIGQENPRDEVVVEGDPPIRVNIPGGIHGDVATVSLVLNALDAISAAPPGLHAPDTLPLPRFRRGPSQRLA